MAMESSQEAKLFEKEAEEEEKHEEEIERTEVKVLIALDESEGSLHALNWALDHLFGNAGSRDLRSLTILHVIQPFPQYFCPGGPGVYVTPMVVDSVIKSQEQHSAALLRRTSTMCSEKHVRAETLKKEGEPKEAICQVVEQIHADLVVIGSRGLGTIKRAVLGSVSDYVAHHAKCPVLIVKPPK
ncbi:uncharacterized protein LOC116247647 [Nymphaea colorata]|uniref:uncharacterized protein LOC116247647 n=1 Tax=Nymphaea colorata TaxID=210225 RepID=UPI00129DFA1C|nr:uncharacterized protein LOC116247647 [Nymphaea colorata]